MSLTIFALSGTALGLLALGMQRHHLTVFGKGGTPARTRFLRVSGWGLLVLSLLLSVLPWHENSNDGWNGGKGLVSWIGLLSLHTFAITLGISYRPKWVPWWTGLWALTALLILLAKTAAQPTF